MEGEASRKAERQARGREVEEGEVYVKYRGRGRKAEEEETDRLWKGQ